jgi:hypothetical protein
MASHQAIGRWALALGLAVGSASAPGFAPGLAHAQPQPHDHAHGGTPPPATTLGSLHFPVSCTPEAQAAFDDAMKLQHSFWYQAADQAHRRVLERDRPA